MDRLWRKAIPEARDGVQSRVLVWVMGTVLVGLSVWTLLLGWPMTIHSPLFGAVAVSACFAGLVWRLRSATPGGAVSGGMTCLLLMFGTASYGDSIARTALTPLLLLFVLTFVSTRAGRRKKAKAGLAESRRGRSASQVIANLSAAALCVTPVAYVGIHAWARFFDSSVPVQLWIEEAMKVMCLAALAEATADTVSSEIGQAYGGAPVMLLSLRRVEPGVDGAVTLLGTVAGVAGSVLVGVAGAWAMHLSARVVGISVGAGVLGLFFDSVLGGTVERRGWLGNDLVNFSSTVFAAGVAGWVYCWLVL